MSAIECVSGENKRNQPIYLHLFNVREKLAEATEILPRVGVAAGQYGPYGDPVLRVTPIKGESL